MSVSANNGLLINILKKFWLLNIFSIFVACENKKRTSMISLTICREKFSQKWQGFPFFVRLLHTTEYRLFYSNEQKINGH